MASDDDPSSRGGGFLGSSLFPAFNPRKDALEDQEDEGDYDGRLYPMSIKNTSYAFKQPTATTSNETRVVAAQSTTTPRSFPSFASFSFDASAVQDHVHPPQDTTPLKEFRSFSSDDDDSDDAHARGHSPRRRKRRRERSTSPSRDKSHAKKSKSHKHKEKDKRKKDKDSKRKEGHHQKEEYYVRETIETASLKNYFIDKKGDPLILTYQRLSQKD
ncbi:hypothetical protein HDV05_001323, partial [Chytridiales sp. JEL 0842]